MIILLQLRIAGLVKPKWFMKEVLSAGQTQYSFVSPET